MAETEKAVDVDYLMEEIPKAIDQSLDGVTRVATLVRAMKEFAHPEQKEKAAANINEALRSTLIVARNELKYVAEVETDLGICRSCFAISVNSTRFSSTCWSTPPMPSRTRRSEPA